MGGRSVLTIFLLEEAGLEAYGPVKYVSTNAMSRSYVRPILSSLPSAPLLNARPSHLELSQQDDRTRKSKAVGLHKR